MIFRRVPLEEGNMNIMDFNLKLWNFKGIDNFVARWNVFFLRRIQVTSVSGALIIINSWVCYDHIIVPIKIFYPNPNQCVTPTKDLSVIIGWYSFIANKSDPLGILAMLAVLIADTETTAKSSTQLWDINRKNRPEKCISLLF